jgi:hypothetical protein
MFSVEKPVLAMRFGPYGREEHCLVLVHGRGAITVKMWKRTADIETANLGKFDVDQSMIWACFTLFPSQLPGLLPSRMYHCQFQRRPKYMWIRHSASVIRHRRFTGPFSETCANSD